MRKREEKLRNRQQNQEGYIEGADEVRNSQTLLKLNFDQSFLNFACKLWIYHVLWPKIDPRRRNRSHTRRTWSCLFRRRRRIRIRRCGGTNFYSYFKTQFHLHFQPIFHFFIIFSLGNSNRRRPRQRRQKMTTSWSLKVSRSKARSACANKAAVMTW